jgi:hypothetical protein
MYVCNNWDTNGVISIHLANMGGNSLQFGLNAELERANRKAEPLLMKGVRNLTGRETA